MERTRYSAPFSLREWCGNLALAPQGYPALSVASLVRWDLSSVKQGEGIAFVNLEGDRLIEAKGLEHFVRTSLFGAETTVFDNHNHALYFWYETRSLGLIGEGATLVHIDMHSDLWDNPNVLVKPDSFDLEKVWKFTNYSCNVGNYIRPAVSEGLIGNVIRIEGEEDLLRLGQECISKNSILNLDLDFFAPELDFIPFSLKRSVILHFAKQVSCITIATSPFFIDQGRAIRVLQRVLQKVF